MPEREGPEAENKRLVRRYVELIWNGGEFERIDEFLRPDYVGHDPLQDDFHGTAGVIKQIGDIHKDFPDADYRIEEMVAEGDRVVTRWLVSGTHRLTRKPVELSGMSMARIEDGRVAESWIERDSMVLLLNVAPADLLTSLFRFIKRLRP